MDRHCEDKKQKKHEILSCIDVDHREENSSSLLFTHSWMDLLDFLLRIIGKYLCHIGRHRHRLGRY